MKYVKPIPLTLTSQTGAISMYPAYNGANSYNKGDIVKVTYTSGTHGGKTPAELFWEREYKALVTMGPQVAGQEPWNNPAWWLDLGPTHPYRLLDDKTSTRTQSFASGSLQVVVAFTGTVSHIGLLMLQNTVAGCSITLKNSGGIIISTVNFNGTGLTKFYCTVPSTTGGSIAVNLPAGGSGIYVGIGHIIAGSAVSLGETIYPAQASILDFSRKEFDQFGDLTLVQRNYADRLAFSALVNSGITTTIKDTLSALRAVPCVWDANPDTIATPDETLRIFGFMRNFTVDIQGLNAVYCHMEIEGLT